MSPQKKIREADLCVCVLAGWFWAVERMNFSPYFPFYHSMVIKVSSVPVFQLNVIACIALFNLIISNFCGSRSYGR